MSRRDATQASSLRARVTAGTTTGALLTAATLGMCLTASLPAAAQTFTYHDPGDLITDSGQGRMDTMNYAPGMRFPMETGPAFANSQVYNPGGYLGPAGGQCDNFNYSYPWRDNYCEIRSWDMPLCPAGTGHQGQDIRPGTCDKDVHWIVAGTDGTITNIGSYSVYLTAADGTRYDYLHMSNVQVSVGESVTRGQRLGLTSNEFGGTPTTIHLHFNIRQYVDGVGTVYVPPYMALISSYQALIGGQTDGSLDTVDCGELSGWAADLGAPGTSINVTLGLATEAGEVLHTFPADQYRSDLCENLSYCDHGFSVPSPLGLFDGEPHDIAAYAGDDGMAPPLDGSPKTMQCEPWELSGLRRAITEDEATAWGFSALWDELPAPAEEVDALEEASNWGEAPELITNEAGDAYWLLDEGELRRIEDDATLRAWRFDPASAEVLDEQARAAYPEGEDLLPRPVLLRGTGDQLYVLDHKGGGIPGLTSGAGVGATSGSGGPSGIPNGLNGSSNDCGCRAVGQTSITDNAGAIGSTALLALLGLIATGRRRRRYESCNQSQALRH